MEHNVALQLLDYDPYQSMTTNQLQKINKLLTFRSLRSRIQSERVMQFIIDVEAWNHFFRPNL